MKNKSYSKMVAIFALVLAIATSLGFALPATLCYAQGGYGGGGGDTVITHPSFTSLIGKIDFYTRAMLSTVVSQSPDKLCQLTINKGTKALNTYGGALTGIINIKMKEPPAPPPNANVIGLVYDLTPAGATFDPPPTLTFTYDPEDIPEGVNEEDLVIAYSGSDWVVLEGSVVDPEANTISAPVSHFTAFTVMAYSTPAAFTVSDLTITPAEVNVGETVTISATVTNTGDLIGDYEAILNINDVVIATKKITLDGPASQEVTFTTSEVAGTYTAGLGGLSGTFTVKGPPAPKPAPPAPKPAPPAPKPAPPAPAPPPQAPTAPPPAPPAPIPWPIIGGIVAGLIVFGVIFWLITRGVEI